MKKVLMFVFLGVSLVFVKFYMIDKVNFSVWFEVKYFKFNEIRGVFDNFDGKIDVDFNIKVFNVFEGNIDVKSINIRDRKRDNYLKIVDFFDVVKYFKGSFKMIKYEDGKIYGDLIFCGVIKFVVLEVKI